MFSIKMLSTETVDKFVNNYVLTPLTIENHKDVYLGLFFVQPKTPVKQGLSDFLTHLLQYSAHMSEK